MTLTVRRPGFVFPDRIPRHWFGGSPLWTHVHNAFTLIFPEGERYLIRIIGRAASGGADPIVRAFLAQESQHATEHQHFLKNLRAQGYAIDPFLETWARELARIESRFGARFHLALVAGVEHLATLLGDFTLRSDALDRAEPVMAGLYAWHAAEEVEHRAVAHDVAKACGVGYLRRQLGLLLAIAILSVLFSSATFSLLRQERELDRWRVVKDAAAFLFGSGLAWHLLTGCLKHLLPGFHPSTISDDAIALRWTHWAPRG